MYRHFQDHDRIQERKKERRDLFMRRYIKKENRRHQRAVYLDQNGTVVSDYETIKSLTITCETREARKKYRDMISKYIFLNTQKHTYVYCVYENL